MRTRPVLILAGAAALGGAAFFMPAVAAQQAEGPTPGLVIACNEAGTSHTYTASVTNNLDGSITVNDDATLTINSGSPGALAQPGDGTVLAGATLDYPTAVPLAGDGDVAVTAVFHVTWGDTETPLTVTATAEPCGTTTTTAPPVEETTTSTSTPAVQAAVDFTG